MDCAICVEKKARYTCPACNTKTCSLECVQRHKRRAECSGVADAAKFVPNKELAANPLLINRDYNYLLNFERRVQLGKSDIKSTAKPFFRRQTPQNSAKRRRVETSDRRMNAVNIKFPTQPATSLKRENTLVVHVPAGMARSTQNKSGFDKKLSKFTWTVEWVLVDEKGAIYPGVLSFRLREDAPLHELVPVAVLGKKIGQELDEANLLFYLDSCVSPTRSAFCLERTQTLTEAITNRVVLEYPTIYVCLESSPLLRTVTDVEVYGCEESTSESDTSSGSGSDSDSDSDPGSDSDLAPEAESARAPEAGENEDNAHEEVKNEREHGHDDINESIPAPNDVKIDAQEEEQEQRETRIVHETIGQGIDPPTRTLDQEELLQNPEHAN